jgi:hypothetical protein
VAAEQAHAAEHAGVVADQVVEILVAALVAGVEPEAGDLVEADRADEILAHPQGAAAGHAAAAFDAAVEFVDGLGELGLHRRLYGREGRRLLAVDPGLEALGGAAHPLAGVHREVADQLEDRQRRQRDGGAVVFGEGAAGQPRAAVDEHPAAAADAGAADEVELQRGVEVLADLVEGDEEGHALASSTAKSCHWGSTWAPGRCAGCAA